MSLRCLLLLSGLVAPLLAAGTRADDAIARFSGRESATTQEFRVKAPWLLDWQVTSEFPDLASFVLRLVDATNGQTVGIVADFSGTGRALKLYRSSGTYRLEVTAHSADWSVEISQISEPWAARLEQMTREAGSERRRSTMSARQVGANWFSGWRARGDQALILIGTGDMNYLISFGSGGCTGLSAAKTLSFVTPDDGPLDVYDSILLEDGTRCYFGELTFAPK